MNQKVNKTKQNRIQQDGSNQIFLLNILSNTLTTMAFRMIISFQTPYQTENLCTSNRDSTQIGTSKQR